MSKKRSQTKPEITKQPRVNGIKVKVLQNHNCEIAGKKLTLKKGEQLILTPFQFKILSNSNLSVKLIEAL